MNKRKIALLAMSACMIAILAIGGTLAYFTDTDYQTNTFTVGNVSIDLFEDFGDNDTTGIEELFPATGSAQNGTLKNGIEKEVYVENTGSEEAYVRVHIAIPTILDNGRPDFNASKNVLHFNYAKESVAEGKWDWSKAADDDKTEGDWNYYEQTIADKKYNVYVVTYTSKLAGKTANAAGGVTCDAMSQVYLDSKTSNEDIAKIKAELGDEWKIYVAAEACQAEGFANAYDALNTAFGVPGSYAADKVIDFTKGAENKTWVDTASSENK